MSMTDAEKQAVFEELADLVRASVPDDTFVIEEKPGQLDVNTAGPVTVDGRKKDNMNLLNLIVQKNHVGFYFMPVYIEPEMKETLPGDTGKMLKGKSCFHVKSDLSDEQKNAFSQMIQRGIALYREKEWV